MSAFIVSKAHIDALVVGAVYGPQGHFPSWSSYFFNPETGTTFDPKSDPSALGRLLLVENIRSVSHLYQEENEGEMAEAAAYTFEVRRRPVDRPSAVALLKLLDSLEYQSSEHPEWTTSTARAFTDALRKRLISTLAGYSEADWTL